MKVKIWACRWVWMHVWVSCWHSRCLCQIYFIYRPNHVVLDSNVCPLIWAPWSLWILLHHGWRGFSKNMSPTCWVVSFKFNLIRPNLGLWCYFWSHVEQFTSFFPSQYMSLRRHHISQLWPEFKCLLRVSDRHSHECPFFHYNKYNVKLLPLWRKQWPP